ncbi:MAG: RnfABCDGE type electron transport complex subunit D [Oscillospiraceae bacterium]|nr:RnfABCDGE type electron transport complex subunit D [Oscillospiraceae bacterium]
MSRVYAGKSSFPCIKDRASVDSIMLDVLVALTPALVMGAFLFGFRVLVLAAISVLSCMGFELLYCKWTKKPVTIRDLSACVTGLLLSMTLPVTAPYWAPVLGGAFAIIVVKQFYGGLGKNFMNPALAGRMLLLSFPGMMTTWVDALDRQAVVGVDAVSTATPMAYLHLGKLPDLTLSQLLLGQHGGAMGEVASFMLLLGGAYLLCRRVISWRIPVCFLGTVAMFSFVFPKGNDPLDWAVCNLFSGGLMLGAIFMATDYTTSPVTPRGQILYGIGCGCLTVVLRSYGSYPDGVGFSILTMNCCVWLLDRVGLPRRFGVRPLTETRSWALGTLRRLGKLRPTIPERREKAVRGTMPGERDLDRIRSWSKNAAAMTAVIVVMAICIGGVNRATGRIIAVRENREQQELLEQVMPAAQVVTETPYMAEDALSILAGYNENELIGYCVEVEVQGFGGVVTMVVGVDVNGEVTGVTVTGHSEHAGIGGQALEQDYLGQYVGLSGTVRDEGRNSVDAISGATDTCRAITAGVNKALYIASRLDAGEVEYMDGQV